MAEKSFVNDDAATVGTGPLEDDAALELDVELDDDELPQPAINAATTSVGNKARLQTTI